MAGKCVERDSEHSLPGPVAGSRFFTYNLYPLEVLQSNIQPELLFVLPGSGLGGIVSFFDLVVDITCVGNKRFITVKGQRFAVLGSNQAVVLVPDVVACDGLIHIVDSVLITPGLTTLRQMILRQAFNFPPQPKNTAFSDGKLWEIQTGPAGREPGAS